MNSEDKRPSQTSTLHDGQNNNSSMLKGDYYPLKQESFGLMPG